MEQVEAKYLAKRAQIVQKYTNMLIVNLVNTIPSNQQSFQFMIFSKIKTYFLHHPLTCLLMI